jgi:hypothetical protein
VFTLMSVWWKSRDGDAKVHEDSIPLPRCFHRTQLLQ